MEQNNWIDTILKSTDGMTSVVPNDELFSKIKNKIQQTQTVSSRTLWLVAASIAALVMVNVSIVTSKSKEKTSSTTAYLEMNVNKSNQLYQ